MNYLTDIDVEIVTLQAASERLDIMANSLTAMEGISGLGDPSVESRNMAELIQTQFETLHDISLGFDFNPFQVEASVEGLGETGRRVYKVIVEVARKIANAFRRLINLVRRTNDESSERMDEVKSIVDTVIKGVDDTIASEGLSAGEHVADTTIEMLRSRGLFVVVDDNNKIMDGRAIRSDVTILSSKRSAALSAMGMFGYDGSFDPTGMFNKYADIIQSMADIDAVSTMESIYRYITGFSTMEDITQVQERVSDPLDMLTAELVKAMGIDKKKIAIPSGTMEFKVSYVGMGRLIKVSAKQTRNKRKIRVSGFSYEDMQNVSESIAKLKAAIANASSVADKLSDLAASLDSAVIQRQHGKLNMMADKLNPDHYKAVNVLISEYTKYIETLASNFSIVTRDAAQRSATFVEILGGIEKDAALVSKV